MTTISIKAIRQLPSMQMEPMDDKPKGYEGGVMWLKNHLRKQILSDLLKINKRR